MGETFDVVVVGSGGGALTGAALAAGAGLSTVVLERTGYAGGTSAYSGGACWLPGSAVQRAAGVTADSTESARTYLGAVLDGADKDRVEAFLGHAPELVAALSADPGFAFEWLPFPEYFDAAGRVPTGRSLQPVSIRRDELPPEVTPFVRPPVERDRAGQGGRRTLTGGQALVARLLAMTHRDGGEIRVEHKVTRLLSDGDRVTGVVAELTNGGAETAAGEVEIYARRGVLLGAGGFEGNPELRAAHDVPGAAAWTMAPSGTNAGELLEAAVAAGAATAMLHEAWLCPGLEQPDGGGSFTLGFRGGVMVDQNGRRYANECLPYDRFGREMAKEADRVPSWLVYDSREGGAVPAIAMPEGDLEAALAAGTRVRAGTIDELAAAIGVDAVMLAATVERFNSLADAGDDADFGRGADEYDRFFSGAATAADTLVPVRQAPFYAARFVLSDLGTKGGLAVDAAARVLRDDGTPLPGLYATGNTAASLTGAVYPGPGIPLGTAMVAASLAVRDILGA